jgi:hypothetical protein
MAEDNWKPTFRSSGSTLTKVLRSPAFLRARERSTGILESPAELRALADQVESLDRTKAPLSAVADQVDAAVRFLRAKADAFKQQAPSRDVHTPQTELSAEAAQIGGAPAGVAARERLLVASLSYLVTPLDLVPDFRAGGYVDDVFLLAWVFGAASSELSPHVDDGTESWG